MKIMMLLIPLLHFKKFNMFILILPLPLMILLLKYTNKMYHLNSFMFLDNMSLILISLTIISTILIILSTNHFKLISLTMIIIMFNLLITFSLNNMFHFYIMFETVLIPTLILISKMGNQPERMQASIYLIMYTILASLPLLISILSMKTSMNFNLSFIEMFKFKYILFLLLAFLVKSPMYFIHLWLPKAHVEAPLEGSMILAAVLLKLGSYGLIRFIPFCLFNLNKMSNYIMSISMLSMIITSLNCMRQKDMKSLIAYSSVAHMALTLGGIFSSNKIGLYGSILMLLAHGMSSSALFLLTNDLYMKMHSRNIILFKGLMSITPNITFWWLMFMAMNMSAPPSINNISEIMILSSLLSWSNFLLLPIIMASFSVACFSLLLFININHNKNTMLSFTMTKNKIFLSLFIHMSPLILLIPKLEIIH